MTQILSTNINQHENFPSGTHQLNDISVTHHLTEKRYVLRDTKIEICVSSL